MNLRFFDLLKREFLPCPGCGGISGEYGNSLCCKCLDELELISETSQLCPGCGGQMSGILGVCTQCLAEPERPWQHAFTLASYQGRMRELIQRFKFYNSPELARPLGLLLAEPLRRSDIRFDLIVPIPLHILRLMRRGYNQTLLLAEIAGAECDIPVADILRKKHFRSRQSSRSRNDRHRELAGSFILNSPTAVKGKNILLLDDVFTTGATLHAATRTLLAAKPESISVLTLARAVGHSSFQGN